jgi:hypothetical protein
MGMTMCRIRLVLVAAVALAAAGCEVIQVLGPADTVGGVREAIVGGVRVTLTLTPDEVTRPGTVMAVLRYENRTAGPVTVTSAYGCLSFAGVYSGSKRIPFPSTEYLCTTALTSHEIAPGSAVGMDWPLEIGGAGVALEPGVYRFVAYLNTHDFNLESTFRVR